MANHTKKYRNCFDESELDFVRCELALYNKLFDEEDWKAKLTLVITDHPEKTEYCKLEENIQVSKNENIYYYRDGWGNEQKGKYWKKGNYKWKVYIDDTLIHEHFFYVNKVGTVTIEDNPYFDISSLSLFEADENQRSPDRKNLRVFNKKETRYVWFDFRFKVKTNESFHYEIFFNFFDDSGQPKAQIRQYGFVDENKSGFEYRIVRGWGSPVPGTWIDDQYSLEIVFNDVRIGGYIFYCADHSEEGEPDSLHDSFVPSTQRTSGGQSSEKEDTSGTRQESMEELLQNLNQLIGLKNLKKEIQEQITYLNFIKLKKEKGLEEKSLPSLHTVFTGNPGTGKTTVVRLLGKIYHRMGLLKTDKVLEVGRAELVGEFIGQTAPKTKAVIDKSRGGILFIDEAYSLSRIGDDGKDFGKEVIEVLLKEMSDGKGDFTLMVAGYPKEMEVFLASNPGLKSRFGNYFHFEDYTPEELLEIAKSEATKHSVVFTEDSLNLLKEKLTEEYRNRDKHFGNARMVCGWIQEARINMGVRIMRTKKQEELTEDDFRLLLKEDIEKIFIQQKSGSIDFKINEKDLQLALDELMSLRGLQSLKNEILDTVKLIRFYNEIGKNVTNKFSMHAVFKGNPGTGKTTVARILAKIYKALGLLERGHCIEVDREGLVAGYVGQTAIKTAEVVEKAIGGVLFVDEAYTLQAAGQNNDFGKEAVEALLKRMEDRRGEFALIVAGYTDNMEEFLKMNPGLASRFDKHYFFEDYSPEELLQIARDMLKKEELYFSEEAAEQFSSYVMNAYNQRDKYFGNARVMRQWCSLIIKNQHLRMAEIPAGERTSDILKTILAEDLKGIDDTSDSQKKGMPSIGFRLRG
jgi:SpoVK/Ycf46/Vps4 family AAA+-type ATPase